MRQSREQKPLPYIMEETKPYWEAARRHELVLLKCDNCSHYRHPLASIGSFMCPNYTSLRQLQWAKASSKGKIITWTVVRRVYHPALANEVPYVAVFALLEEGRRMQANLRDIKPEDIKADTEVEVFFDDLTEEVVLPQLHPRDSSANPVR